MEDSSIIPPAGPGEFAPVAPQERILLIDLLRGFACVSVLCATEAAISPLFAGFSDS
jgi:uncharacterized membrane protein YeiB